MITGSIFKNPHLGLFHKLIFLLAPALMYLVFLAPFPILSKWRMQNEKSLRRTTSDLCSLFPSSAPSVPIASEFRSAFLPGKLFLRLQTGQIPHKCRHNGCPLRTTTLALASILSPSLRSAPGELGQCPSPLLTSYDQCQAEVPAHIRHQIDSC